MWLWGHNWIGRAQTGKERERLNIWKVGHIISMKKIEIEKEKDGKREEKVSWNLLKMWFHHILPKKRFTLKSVLGHYADSCSAASLMQQVWPPSCCCCNYLFSHIIHLPLILLLSWGSWWSLSLSWQSFWLVCQPYPVDFVQKPAEKKFRIFWPDLSGSLTVGW